MSRQTLFNLIFNGIGALIGLVLVGYVVSSLFLTETESPCSGRYPSPTRFPLQTSAGALLSTAELQARVGINEWGVTENAKVIPVADAPAAAALEIKLAAVPDVETGRGRPANGVYFRWRPPGTPGVSAACLGYALWLPDDFDFAHGGLLPGLFGAPPDAVSDPNATSGFTQHLQWRAGGEGRLEVATEGQHFSTIGARGVPLPKGRWIRVEQELVLNTPGEADGIARLWIDGALAAEGTGIAIRKTPTATIAGVLADIGYLGEPATPGTLRLTAFELSWK